MKRKVNQVGTGTLTISLPSKWVKDNGIKKGDEIELYEDSSRLIVEKEKVTSKLDLNIDLSDSGVMLNRMIAAIYKAGFDEVRVKYKTPNELDVIQNTVYRSCHVYEIMNVKENVVEIKSISDLDDSQFKQVLRKMAFSFITVAKEAYEFSKDQDYDSLENIPLKDQTIDRHTDFCRRIINKGGDVGYKLIAPVYVVVEETEIAADVFKILVKTILKEKKKLNADVLDLFKKIVVLIEKFYDAFFDFKIDKMKEFGKLEINIREKIDIICSSSRKDSKVVAYLIDIFETVFEMKSALLTLNLAESTTIK